MAPLEMYTLMIALGTATCVFARPQGLLFNREDDAVKVEIADNEILLTPVEMFDPNPSYSYSYQVASVDTQTYMSKEETLRDGITEGVMRHVDPNGALVTTRYISGPMGINMTTTIQQGFLQIRPIEVTSVSSQDNLGIFTKVIQRVQPEIKRTIVTQREITGESSAGSGANIDDIITRIIIEKGANEERTSSTGTGTNIDDITGGIVFRKQITEERTSSAGTGINIDDLIARIVAQLTPVVDETVSTSLNGNVAISTTTISGANNVKFQTPDFDLAFELSDEGQEGTE